MSFSKKFLDNATSRRFLCWLGACYIRFVHATSRWTVYGDEKPRSYWRERKPFILAFWHGRLLMFPYAWQGPKPTHVLISRHRDGQLIADTIAHFNIGAIAGSTDRGGAGAVRAILGKLKAGQSVGITPDGPRGPGMKVSGGVITLARLSGLPVFPVSIATSRRRVMSSWDRFILSLPFSRGVIVWGDPVSVARHADPAACDKAGQELEDALNELSDRADRLCGVEPVPVAGEK